MKAIEFERLRYHVTSRTGQEPYLVDIGSNYGLGYCDCPDFKCNKFGASNIAKREGIPWKIDAFRCAHIIVARRQFFDEMLDRMIAQFRKEFNDYSEDL